MTALEDAHGVGADAMACADDPAPSLRELRALAAVAPGASLRAPVVWDGSDLAAMAVCSVAPRRVSGWPVKSYGALGSDVYDYARLYYRSEAALAALLREIHADAQRCGADIVFLEDLVRQEDAPQWFSERLTRRTTRVFDSRLESDGWGAIVSRKRLRRLRTRIMKGGHYEVVHQHGDLTPGDLEAMAALHRERWAFDGITSPFANPARLEQFTCYPANKHLTTVLLDEEPLACHFGMGFGETMVFHTPAINIKRLSLSPIQALLWEVANYCAEHGYTVLDFGIGDESYKDRFTNAERSIAEYCRPVSPRGHAALGVRRILDPGAALKRAKAAKHRAWRAKIHVQGWINRVDCFERAPEAGKPEAGKPEAPPAPDLLIADRFEDYVDACRRYGAPLERSLADRYQSGAFYVALHNGQEIVSSGWGTRSRRFYIEELDRFVDPGGALMLFDFNTPAPHRRRGHYTRLLQCLLEKYAGETCCIFALRHNAPSIKAIRKAGFQPRPVWPRAEEAPPRGPTEEAGNAG